MKKEVKMKKRATIEQLGQNLFRIKPKGYWGWTCEAQLIEALLELEKKGKVITMVRQLTTFWGWGPSPYLVATYE